MLQVIVVLTVVGLMFFSSKETKLILFIVSFLCLNLFSLEFGPLSTVQNLLIIAYCLTERQSLINSFAILKKYKVFWIVVLMIIPSIVLNINSPHYHDIKGVIAIFIYEIVLKYMMLWIGFSILSKHYNYKRIYRSAYYALIILTIFGVINTLHRSAPWISWLGDQNYDAVFDNTNERFHARALFANSFNYGYMCLISITWFYYGYLKKIFNKNIWFQVLAMCVFGILIHGSRTVLSCSFVFVMFILIAQSYREKRVLYLLGMVVSFILLYYFSPYVNERVDMLIDTFDPTNDISGSSLDMREMQYATVLNYIQGHQVFGRGYQFFYNDLGWGQFYSGGRVDADLRGLEGVHLNYLLERGIFGYTSYLLFYAILLIVLLRNKGERTAKVLAISVLVIYLLFSHMTGELGTAPVALFFIGMLYRMSIMGPPSTIVQQKNHQQNINCK